MLDAARKLYISNVAKLVSMLRRDCKPHAGVVIQLSGQVLGVGHKHGLPQARLWDQLEQRMLYTHYGFYNHFLIIHQRCWILMLLFLLLSFCFQVCYRLDQFPLVVILSIVAAAGVTERVVERGTTVAFEQRVDGGSSRIGVACVVCKI